MKVQTKITLLLIAVVATFLVGLWAFRVYDRLKFRRIVEQRYNERNRSFEEFLKRHGEPLETLAQYDTEWSGMAKAIATDNTAWFKQNVESSTLEGYLANAVWIYRPDFTPVYDINNLYDTDLHELPVPTDALPKIFAADRLVHFWVQTPKQGVMEICGATVVPSLDDQHRSTPRGYFFVGRRWSNKVIEEMEVFTGNKITLVPISGHADEPRADEANGSIAFSRVLSGWDGRPVAQLIVRSDSENAVVSELNRAGARLLPLVCIFALVLLLLISLGIFHWVNQPLHQMMASLTRNDPKPIERIARSKSEFGELARTIHKFFEQRDNLIREIEERRATEEALRKSEEALQHSQKMEAVGRLAGGVAHDFNNLLTAIIGYAELISMRPKVNPIAKQNADLIRKAGEQAAMLTRQLLAFSRKQMLQPKVVDLNDLVRDMEKLLRRVIGERFELESQPNAEDGRVRADPGQVEQVVLNLGVNARDAMPSGGKLIIKTENVRLDEKRARQIDPSLLPGDYVVLSVIDNGMGMDEATQARIFEPFFTTKGPGKGTGLGLATVYGIVRQTGGCVSVESELGKGSKFCIFLPHETAAIDYVKPALTPVEKTGNSETVLVVEDEEIVRELVCDVLSDQGYNVLCAEDGVHALEIAEKFDGEIHLLVTDVIMPNMNGHELAIKLSAIRTQMKVLYVSGYSDNDIGEHGVLDPKIDLLQKPFT
ncbi:MAG: ATP-binding protein, partial [Verrucomicrobiota bacterium]|nr:ATP-binding protein [Verrucomicrobiota bacterium]